MKKTISTLTDFFCVAFKKDIYLDLRILNS